MKNKSLILFIVIGFIVTVMIWGFVGGCGTVGSHRIAVEKDLEEPAEAEGLIFEQTELPSGVTVYIVETGDTLWGISKEMGVSISDIKSVNNLTKDTISVGQRLIIPGKIKHIPVKKKKATKEKSVKPKKSSAKSSYSNKKDISKGDLVVYRVRKGDSLWRIAQIHGVTVARIAELNGMSRNAQLKQGQELLVPKEK